ncbi:MAG: alpha/beta hydrolase [Candidatus Velthaea sp.]|jgi:pimeloyl-ACP methyl ester carboxylesterase
MTHQLKLPGGTIAYDDRGTGPLVICVPGMGDLRSTYRFSTPLFAGAGYRVVCLDVRGMGETSVSWDDYSVGAIGGDIVNLVEALGAGPAHVVGNSMAAGAAVVAAARRPDLVRSVTLTAPFVRDIMPAWAAAAIFGPMLSGPWRAALWNWYMRIAFPTRVAPDQADETLRRNRNLAEPGRFDAFRRMALASKRASAERLADVTVPVLVVMGTRDPDFPNPAKEARHVAGSLHGKLLMVEGAGHYPQADSPDVFTAGLLDFFGSVDAARPAVIHGS